MGVLATPYAPGYRDFHGKRLGPQIAIANGETSVAVAQAGLWRIASDENCRVDIGPNADGTSAAAYGDLWPTGRVEPRFLDVGDKIAVVAATVESSGGLSTGDSTNLADVETNTANAVTELGAIKAAVEATVSTLPPTALGTTSRYSRKIIDISSSSEVAQITAVADQIIRVYGFHLITPVAANELAVWNGPITDANQLDLRSFAGAGAGHWWFDPGDPIWITGTNKGLVFKPTGAARITGLLLYTQGA